VAKALLHTSTASVLAGSPSAQLVDVAGFAAAQTEVPALDPRRACQLYVDVAPDQSLAVLFDNTFLLASHGAACQKARQAAEFMIAELRKHQGFGP
jgi:hypothetical protein